ncbi:hypothetical protein vseg_015982 [Gypsophila vaccaria]
MWLMFDGKLVVVKPWSDDADLVKDEAVEIRIWVKLHELSLKVWGEECLEKITRLIGSFLRTDANTMLKTFAGFYRVLVNVKMGQEFPNQLKILDEKGNVQVIRVTYDWLPIKCSLCGDMGHQKDDCRKDKQQPKQIWKKKKKTTT